MYREFWEKIEESKKIAIVSHLSPDGDTLGSSHALYLTLKRMQKKVSLVNFDKEKNFKFDFLKDMSKIKNDLPINCDLIITCDCSDLKTAGFEKTDITIINIDHHISNTNFGDINIVNIKSSCGYVVNEILKTSPIKLNREIYESLYVACAEDTDYFRANNFDKDTLEVICEFVQNGVDPQKMTRHLTQNEPLSLTRLRSRAMSSIELHIDGKVASMILTDSDFTQTGALRWMSKNFASIGLSISNVDICFITKEKKDGTFKISLRSNNVDISDIATSFGGGGHKNAAAFSAVKFDKQQFIEILKGKL
jgi:phosphoesterase RecJ-like protein